MRNKKLLTEEIYAWFDILPLEPTYARYTDFITLFKLLPEFRSLLYWRFGVSSKNPLCIIYPGQVALTFPPKDKVGKRLIIQHGFSTIINADRIGDDCQIWQNVTIGKARSGKDQPCPVIGNNVKICAHSVVLGGITIGDNVTIGASAVVTKSIPSGCTVVGNPAKIIQREG